MRSPGSASWAHARAHERTIGPCLLRGACARRRDHRLRRKHGDGFGSCRCASPSPCLRSEEHTSELQSLMRISYAVFCLKKKKTTNTNDYHTQDIINTEATYSHH